MVVAGGMAIVTVRVSYFEFLGVKQNFIPDMWQMVFVNVPVVGWIIHPSVNHFFALMRFWSSLPTMLKLSTVVG